MDSYEFNKIAGWVLAASIVVLGGSVATSFIYGPKPLKKAAYIVEGVEAEVPADAGAGESTEKPIAFYLASASVEKGAAVFKKCASCHQIAASGGNGIGPNLYGVVGKPHASVGGFAYSAALSATKGKVWDWDDLNGWLKNPKAHIAGNKMSFAGLGKPEDRGAVIAYMNAQSASPLPLPAVPAEAAAAPADEKAAGAATPTSEKAAPAAGKAPDVPEAEVADQQKQPQGNRTGPGAADVTGTSEREVEPADKGSGIAKK